MVLKDAFHRESSVHISDALTTGAAALDPMEDDTTLPDLSTTLDDPTNERVQDDGLKIVTMSLADWENYTFQNTEHSYNYIRIFSSKFATDS